MRELRWERCKDNRYAGYDDHEFVALLKPIVFERRGRGDLTGAQVFEDAWTWELYDTDMNILHWGDELTLVKAKEAAEKEYDAHKFVTKRWEDNQ
nr:MAG TPA: hypothetical protein [Caudoviricetes sp.]